jgi:hypothetical protein
LSFFTTLKRDEYAPEHEGAHFGTWFKKPKVASAEKKTLYSFK